MSFFGSKQILKDNISFAFFPNISRMSKNPYWSMLAESLESENNHFIQDTPDAFDLFFLFQYHNKIDVLHIHYIRQFYMSSKRRARLIYVFRFAFLLLIARALGYSTVFTLHNLEPTEYLKPAWVDGLGHWVVSNLVGKVIVHCEEARRLLAKKYWRSKHVFTVAHPNYIDLYPNSISAQEAKRELGLSDQNIVFLFFGGIRPNKGIEMLINAFYKIKDERLLLLIAGSQGRNDDYLQHLKKLACIDDRIKFFAEYIPDGKIQVFMNAADIVVLPFAKILTSGSAILAMSFARPVIVPAMGCLPELVDEDAGWIFDPSSSGALASIMMLASSSDLKKTGLQAFSAVSALSSKKIANETTKGYKY
jgi:beta-1,4-mannosyltransferase